MSIKNNLLLVISILCMHNTTHGMQGARRLIGPALRYAADYIVKSAPKNMREGAKEGLFWGGLSGAGTGIAREIYERRHTQPDQHNEHFLRCISRKGVLPGALAGVAAGITKGATPPALRTPLAFISIGILGSMLSYGAREVQD